MKKRKLILILSIVLVAFILPVAILLSGNQFTVAKCIVTDSGSLYMVYGERPVHLNYKSDTNCRTGDKLLVIHQSAFAESYPEQTRAYLIIKLSSGSAADIPQKAFDVLIEPGNLAQ